jgi:cytochrome c oxidase assembly protein subunit 15
MGVGTDLGSGVGSGVAPTPPRPRRGLGWTSSPLALRRLAIASLASNVLIVASGGAVRLTKSGLGCPTWPKCTGDSLTPTKAYSFHGIIEFTNRQLTFVLALLSVLTLIAAWRQKREVLVAALAFSGIPAQALLGGVTVLTDLNPYAVAGHFLLSMAVLALYALLVWRLDGRRPVTAPLGGVWLARILVTVGAVVLALGTVVTGAGPHAGDVKAGSLHRIHLAPGSASQLHADVVMILIGLTVGLLALAYAARLPSVVRAVWVLLGIEFAQGFVGYLQYFLHLPPALVDLHMVGASFVWLGTLYVHLLMEPTRVRAAA